MTQLNDCPAASDGSAAFFDLTPKVAWGYQRVRDLVETVAAAEAAEEPDPEPGAIP